MKKMFTYIFVCFLFWVVVFPRVSSADETEKKEKIPAKLFRHAVGDLENTFASWPMLLVIGGGIAAGAVSQFDYEIAGHFQQKHLGDLDEVCNVMGQPYAWDTAALAVFAIGKIGKFERVGLAGESMVEALFFTELITGAMKFSIGRHRPNGGTYGFPSSHASRTFAVAAVLETLEGPAFGVPAFLLAGLISFTRLDSNVHYTSDVIFGAALGSAIGWGTARFHKKIHPDLFVAPLIGEVNGLQVAYRF